MRKLDPNMVVVNVDNQLWAWPLSMNGRIHDPGMKFTSGYAVGNDQIVFSSFNVRTGSGFEIVRFNFLRHGKAITAKEVLNTQGLLGHYVRRMLKYYEKKGPEVMITSDVNDAVDSERIKA